MDRSPSARADQGHWVLYRIDDNGNEVPMRRCATRDEAETLMCDYETRGHKQAYLIHEERDLPAP